MSQTHGITRWNKLALLAVVGGAALTLGVDQLVLRRWAASGIQVPVGALTSVNLPGGAMHVYYESLESVPTDDVLLAVTGADGAAVRPSIPMESSGFRVPFAGSGRALWAYDDLEAGPYRVLVNNPNFVSNEAVPDGDRIVFAKSPDTLGEVLRTRRVIQLAGAAITILAAGGLYVAHARTLRAT